MDLSGQTAVVTGGAVRVGRAISVALAGAGADVFVHYNRSRGPAEETAEVLRSLGVRAVVGSANLSDPSSAVDLMAAAGDALGPVSLLVNSASGFPEDTIEDATLEGWARTIDLTLAAPVFLTQAFARSLRRDRIGAVVNVTDVKTMTPYRERFSYTIAKGGIDTFTRAAALALAPRIRVNAVALGVILPPPGEGAEYLEALAASLPLERAGGTGPVTETVLFLLRNEFVTGEIVRVDGGAHLV